MPAATKRLVAFLAVFAFVVAILNIYRWFVPSKTVQEPQTAIFITPTPLLIPVSTPSELVYSSQSCGLELTYPSSFSKTEDASGSAILATADGRDALFITCNKKESPPVTYDKRESVKVASASAYLYHQTIEGQALDTLVVRHPVTNVRIFIAGRGASFDAALKSVKFNE